MWRRLSETCTHTRVHTQLCNGVEFYGSTQILANTALCFVLQQSALHSSPGCSFTHSSVIPSNHLCAFHHLCCDFWLCLLFILIILLPQYSFRFALPSLVSLFLPYSPSTSLLPLSVFSSLRIFYFHHFFGFISVHSLHLITPLSFPQMSLCYKYFIWLKSTFLCIRHFFTHAHIHFWYLFCSNLLALSFFSIWPLAWLFFQKQFHPFCLTKCFTKCVDTICFTSSFLQDGLFRVFEGTESWFNITKFSSSHCAR